MRWLVLLVALAFVAFAHLRIGTLLLARTHNTDKDILSAGQKQALTLAEEAREDLTPDFNKGVSQPLEDWFPHRTDGVVNPLWPWMAAWMAGKDQGVSPADEVTAADRVLFNRGRRFNVGWTLGLLIVLGIACTRVFSVGAAVNVVLLTGFGALLPRAVWFQPEPVYYALFLVTWTACAFALHKNSLWMHILIGVFGGLAYLANDTVVLLIAVYVLVSTLRWLWGWVEAWWPGSEAPTTMWLRRNHWIALFLMGFCFLMTAGPRLSYSDRTFGRPLHSLPARWMWLDNAEQAAEWTNERSATASLPPSWWTYSATHARGEMRHRLKEGIRTQFQDMVHPVPTEGAPAAWQRMLEDRGLWLGWLAASLAFTAVCVCFASPRPLNAAQRLHPEAAAQFLFALDTVAVYIVVYGWYAPIEHGPRFFLALYSPVVLCMAWAGESLLRRGRRRGAAPWIFGTYHLAQWLLAAFVSWRLIQVLCDPAFLN